MFAVIFEFKDIHGGPDNKTRQCNITQDTATLRNTDRGVQSGGLGECLTG